jgi:exoribonuclease-2
VQGVVLRENLVRLEGLPLVVRVNAAPTLDPGTRVRLEASGVDLIERSAAWTFRETLGAAASALDAAEDTGQKA